MDGVRIVFMSVLLLLLLLLLCAPYDRVPSFVLALCSL